MLESAPDSAVRGLDAALRSDRSASLAPVRALVRAEAADRAVRDMVLAPLLPLCAPRGDGFTQAQLPLGSLSRLWKGLRAIEPLAITVVASNLTLAADDGAHPPAADDLCRSAAAAIRGGAPAMAPLIRFLDDAQPGAADQFAGYVELIPLARQAIKRLPLWLRNMSGEHAAAVRLLFKDADAIAGDASPRLAEMLLAHMQEPWKLLRVISAMTNRGGDRYLSSSEMAEFCERVIADIEARVSILRALDLDGGPDGAVAASAALSTAIAEIIEFEECLDLNKEGPWGQKILKQKGALSGVAEGYLKKSPKIVGEALPMQQVRAGGLKLRSEPRLSHAPDPRLIRRAMASLTFFERCRNNAASGGYGSIRIKAGEEITHSLDNYVQDILSMIHTGDAENLDHARAFLEIAADFTGLVQDEKSAQIVRRRTAAAF
jgi:hypothetical protein